MPDREKVIYDIERCICRVPDACRDCSHYGHGEVIGCMEELLTDVLALLKEQEEEHRRLLSWLGKFCRHIDNGDAWLTDEENIAFFKEKMKQQFGWETD